MAVGLLFSTYILNLVLIIAITGFPTYLFPLTPHNGISVLCYLEVVIWAELGLINIFLRRVHHKGRSQGYLKFYREIRRKRKTPFVISSFGCVYLLFSYTIIRDVTKEHINNLAYPFLFIQILGVVQFCLVLFSSTYYIVLVRRFNKARALPDIFEDDYISDAERGHLEIESIGYRSHGVVEAIMEKQNDLIRYLIQYNKSLVKKLADKNQQLRINDESNSVVVSATDRLNQNP